MNKLLIPTIICITLTLFVSLRPPSDQQHSTVSLRDSMLGLLDYFYTATNDKNLKQDIEAARRWYTTNIPNDSAAEKLVSIARQTREIFVDYMMAGIEPFKKIRVWQFARVTEDLCKYMPPQGSNRWYAAALHQSGLSFSATTSSLQFELEDYFVKALAIKNSVHDDDNAGYFETLFYTIWFDGNINAPQRLEQMLQVFAQRNKLIKEPDGIYLEQAHCIFTGYLAIHDLERADSVMRQKLVIAGQMLDTGSLRYARLLCNTGVHYSELSQYTRALQLYTKAKDITEAKAGKENMQYFACLNCIGSVYNRLGLYKEALNISGEVLELARNHDTAENYSLPLYFYNHATNYLKMGDYANALPLFRRAIKKNEEFNNGTGSSFIWNKLSVLYLALGQYEEASATIQNGLALSETLKNRNHDIFYLNLLNSMGMLYGQKGQYDSAIFYCRRSLEMTQNLKGTQHGSYLSFLNNLAGLYIQTRRYKEAEKTIEELLATEEKIYGKVHPDYARALFTRGELYFSRNKCDEARRFYQQALSIQKEMLGEQHPDYIKTLSRLGQVELITKNNRDAARYFVQANRLTTDYIRTNYISLSEQEKMTLLKENAEQFSYLLSMLAVQKYNPPDVLQQVYNNELVLKNMVMLDQENVLRTIEKSENRDAITLYEEWRNDKSLLAVQLLKPIKDRIPGMDNLKEKIADEEGQLSKLSFQFNAQQQKLQVTVNEIAQRLEEEEAAIEFARFAVFGKNNSTDIWYAALVLLTGDTIPQFIPLCREPDLVKLIENTEASLADIKLLYPRNGVMNYLADSLSKRLFTLVWKPIQPYLTNVSTIYYAPAGLLNRISMQGLRVSSTQLLIDRFKMVQFLSTRSVVLSETPKSPATVNIWANIQYDYRDTGPDKYKNRHDDLWAAAESPAFNFYNWDSRESRGNKLKPLPGTKKEMEQIRRICADGGMKVSVINDIYATEDAFKGLDSVAPQVLHIATHGFFLAENANTTRYKNNPFVSQQNPMLRCGLALAGCNPVWTGEEPVMGEDGILTAYEIAQMDLSNTDIVVLSACETALGDIQGSEGVIGLQRAFKMAGVKQLIMSLWKVPDKETSELMELFYKNWLSGMSAREALRKTQLDMKQKYDPYYWAAFLLIE